MKFKINWQWKSDKNSIPEGWFDIRFLLSCVAAVCGANFLASIILMIANVQSKIMFFVFSLIFSFLLIDKTSSMFYGKKIKPLFEIKK